MQWLEVESFLKFHLYSRNRAAPQTSLGEEAGVSQNYMCLQRGQQVQELIFPSDVTKYNAEY